MSSTTNLAVIPISDIELLVRKAVNEEVRIAFKAMSEKQTEPLLTREELALKLGKCSKTISNYEKAGVPHVKIVDTSYFYFSKVIEHFTKKESTKNKRR